MPDAPAHRNRPEGMTAIRLDVHPAERDHFRRLAADLGMDLSQLSYAIFRDYLEAHPHPKAPPLPPKRVWHHRRRPPLSDPPEPPKVAPAAEASPPAKRGRGRPAGSGMRPAKPKAAGAKKGRGRPAGK
jgi:hypothetical protein